MIGLILLAGVYLGCYFIASKLGEIVCSMFKD